MVISTLLFSSSCVTDSANSSRKSQGAVSNSPSSVGPGEGRVLQDNPIVASGNANLPHDTSLVTYLQREPVKIIDSQFLTSTCGTSVTSSGLANINDCVKVSQNKNATQFNSPTSKWAYPVGTTEFLQVNTFYHIQKGMTLHHDNMKGLYNHTWGAVDFPQPFSSYDTAMPKFVWSNKGHWKLDPDNQTLKAFADCDLNNNAYYDPATFSLCFGYDQVFKEVKFAQDDTVIYHELGHALNDIMLNVRNKSAALTEATSLGYFFYDEAGSLGEGLADFASYIIELRTMFGEWALGRFNVAARPMSEREPIHVAGLAPNEDSRLLYPTYLTYDPNDPASVNEDIHYAGQIISHYLVALAEDFESQCSMSKQVAANYVMKIVMEAMAELGDLTSQGGDTRAVGYINHSAAHAHDWIRHIKPITYRSFSQSLAKYTMRLMGNPTLNLCNGTVYNRDRLEKLIDSYGLLLFRSYNEVGNAVGSVRTSETQVTPTNRLKSTLAPKELLIFDPRENASKAFVFDGRADMLNALESMTDISISSQIDGDLKFNNGNAKISPGELVGLSLNLYNNSNSTMSGIQVLANDWDHVKWEDTVNPKPYKQGKFCNNFGDEFPIIAEGGADSSTEGGSSAGECKYITRQNGDEANEQLAPVCMVQINETNSTKWALQEELRLKLSLEASNCLGGSTSTQDCFIRAVKGADSSWFSKIDPQETWGNTLATSSGVPQFNFSNIIFFEVSPWIPPGTTFNCRFRARFVNCEDCYEEKISGKYDEFLDYEFSGGKPFQVVNFQFTVID
ncbi:MAG: hypothetical protein KC493_14880 [Bacteriovoracaceae bacterium]|nr:hypothetical protein [Bacteriovoracaceae bacterium]